MLMVLMVKLYIYIYIYILVDTILWTPLHTIYLHMGLYNVILEICAATNTILMTINCIIHHLLIHNI